MYKFIYDYIEAILYIIQKKENVWTYFIYNYICIYLYLIIYELLSPRIATFGLRKDGKFSSR